MYIEAMVMDVNARPPRNLEHNSIAKLGASEEAIAERTYIKAMICSVLFLPNILLAKPAKGRAITTPKPAILTTAPSCRSLSPNSADIKFTVPDINAASRPKTKPPKATIEE